MLPLVPNRTFSYNGSMRLAKQPPSSRATTLTSLPKFRALACVTLLLTAGGYWLLPNPSSHSQPPAPPPAGIVPSRGPSSRIVAEVEPPTSRARFDGQRAYGYLKQLCEFGVRMSGSAGMLQQQKLLDQHFSALGGETQYQRFQVRHPLTGQPVAMANLIVVWRPAATERMLLCAHYDTRPLPDQDPNPQLRRQGAFLGANDGASGVAVLMELAHHVAQLPEQFGLDFVLFDGEELVYDDNRDRYFLGSQWFAEQYRDHPPVHRYSAGVLLDMVGDRRLSLFQEKHSVTWAGTRPLVKEIWNTAARLGVREFIPRAKYTVRDDHLPLNRIARIPVCDVIDYEYPDRTNRYWHTTEDTPEHCSAESLGKVGWVIQEWLATRSRLEHNGR